MSLVFGGVKLLASWIGYRSATAIAIASTGKTVARKVIPIAIRTLCGPLAPLISDSMVNPLVDAVMDKYMPSPFVILRDRVYSNVVYVAVSGIKQGGERVLFIVNGMVNRVKNLIDPEQTTTVKVKGALTDNLIDDYNPTLYSKDHYKSTNDSNFNIDNKSVDAIILEFTTDEMETIVNNFEGEKIEMTKEQFQDYIRYFPTPT